MEVTVLLIMYVALLLKTSGSLDINSVLYNVYKIEQQDDKPREKEFITQLWPEISKLVPPQVRIPKVSVNFGMRGYLCSKPTDIDLQVGSKLTNINIESDHCGSHINCNKTIFEAELHFIKPVQFEIGPQNCLGLFYSFTMIDSDPVVISYSFNKKNTIKFELKIPDFSVDNNILHIKCYICIESIDIKILGEPDYDKESYIGDQFWKNVKNTNIYTMLNEGIMSSLLNINDKYDVLFCISDLLKETLTGYQVSGHSSNLDERVEKHEQKGNNKNIRNDKPNRPTAKYIKSIQYGIIVSIEAFKSELVSDDFFSTKKHFYNTDKEKFSLITYAPLTFKHLRNIFSLTEEEYVSEFCKHPLQELRKTSNSGARFYLSHNKYFIAKTTRKDEIDFLQGFLRSYILNLKQNPFTLLPKLFGLYEYNSLFINGPRLLVMNYLLPADVQIDQKYDLKGAIFKRSASKIEKSKTFPTFKDNDFKRHQPQGIFLKPDDYVRLMKAIKNDISLLRDSGIIDYSLLLGLHYVDRSLRTDERDKPGGDDVDITPCFLKGKSTSDSQSNNGAQGDLSMAGIQAFTARGDRLLLYMGIIDVLQTYNAKKQFEHFLVTSVLQIKGAYNVHPQEYEQRFENFMKDSVFKKC